MNNKNLKEILSLLESKKTIIIFGGDQFKKSSQIPKYLMDNNSKTIVCSEPKRNIVLKLAESVSNSLNEEIGKTIGYGIRFEEKVSNETKIKYMTDGLLIREMLLDPLLKNYSIIMVDGVNERSISSDLLLALLKRLQINRNDLKLIISTTNKSNANEIYQFFIRNSESNNVEILSIDGDSNNSNDSSIVPEIQRCNDLSIIILQLKALGIYDLMNFDMITLPSTISLKIANSINQLFKLGAITTNDIESSRLTSIGNVMIGLPLDPIYTKIIIESEKLGCSEEILTIISILNNNNDLFIGNLSSTSNLIDTESDHITLLNIYNSFLSNQCSLQWCNDNNINFESIKRIQQIREQLLNCLNKKSIKLESCIESGNNCSKHSTSPIKKSLLSGFYNNIAKLTNSTEIASYETIKDPIRKVCLHPNSFITPSSQSQYLLFNEVATIGEKEYIKIASVIDPSWL